MFQTALTEAFKNCTKSMQKAVIRERIEVTRMMLKKLRDEIGHVVISLYENFEYSLNAQRENIISDFNEIVRYFIFTAYNYLCINIICTPLCFFELLTTILLLHKCYSFFFI